MKRAVEVIVGVVVAASVTLATLEWLLDWMLRASFEDKRMLPTL